MNSIEGCNGEILSDKIGYRQTRLADNRAKSANRYLLALGWDNHGVCFVGGSAIFNVATFLRNKIKAVTK